jgi:hypothetical protein
MRKEFKKIGKSKRKYGGSHNCNTRHALPRYSNIEIPSTDTPKIHPYTTATSAELKILFFLKLKGSIVGTLPC